jgi:hypothetical protein
MSLIYAVKMMKTDRWLRTVNHSWKDLMPLKTVAKQVHKANILVILLKISNTLPKHTPTVPLSSCLPKALSDLNSLGLRSSQSSINSHWISSRMKPFTALKEESQFWWLPIPPLVKLLSLSTQLLSP